MQFESQCYEIPELLHDATLEALHWDGDAALLCLHFNCLRRDLDGSKLENPNVEIRLKGVVSLAVGYDTVEIEQKPSELIISPSIALCHLPQWPPNSVPADLAITSGESIERLVDVVRLDWLLGAEADEEAARLQVRVGLGCNSVGDAYADIYLLAGCEAIEAYAGSLPLSIERWREEYQLWWNNWDEHWASRDQEGLGGHEAADEDAFMPLDDCLPDTDYTPPREPAFAVDSNGAPDDVLKPLRNFYEGHLSRDWQRMALAYVGCDEPDREDVALTAADLKEDFEGFSFGRWGYARAVDEWWVDGNRALVVLRGIEHAVGDELTPVNTESVWTYSLRLLHTGWAIRRSVQGWPAYGSAPSKPESEKPWLQGWSSGDVA